MWLAVANLEYFVLLFVHIVHKEDLTVLHYFAALISTIALAIDIIEFKT